MADALANASGSAAPQVVRGNPVAHDPQANGSVDNVVKHVKGLVRNPCCWRFVQSRTKGEIPVGHPV
eukprot:6774069-Alexandrium_andersonii.AAC.1